MKDRLSNLCEECEDSPKCTRKFLPDVQLQRSSSQTKKLQTVLKEVEDIRELIQLIVENVNIVKDLQNNVLSYTNKDIKCELENRWYSISQTASRVQNKLKEMRRDITKDESATVEDAKDGPVHTRVKALQYVTMMRMFTDAMRDYDDSMTRYHEKCTWLLHRQKMLVDSPVSYEETELLDSQERNLFVDNILQESRLTIQQLSDIESRHEEILKLEASIREVRDMFTRMAMLVEEQGEQLNCVEYFAGTATDNVESGKSDLEKAASKRRKLRKTKTKIYIIIAVVLGILLLTAAFL